MEGLQWERLPWGRLQWSTSAIIWTVILGSLQQQASSQPRANLTGLPNESGGGIFVNENSYRGYRCTVYNTTYPVNVTLVQPQPTPGQVLNHTSGNGTVYLEYLRPIERSLNRVAVFCNCSPVASSLRSGFDQQSCQSGDVWYYINFYPKDIQMTVNPVGSISPAIYQAGQTLTLSCRTDEGYPERTRGTVIVQWSRNGSILENSTLYRIYNQSERSDKYWANITTSSLTVVVDRTMHNAEYRCGVLNHPNATYRSYSFQVFFKPMLINNTVFHTDDVKLTVYIRARPSAIQVQWEKDGAVIELPSSRYELEVTNSSTDDAVVKIELEIDMEDSDTQTGYSVQGMYTCLVTNSIGSTRITFTVDDLKTGPTNIVIIAAAAGAGGLVLLILVIFTCVCCCYRNKNNADDKNTEYNEIYMTPAKSHDHQGNNLNGGRDTIPKMNAPAIPQPQPVVNTYQDKPKKYENWGPGYFEAEVKDFKEVEVIHTGRFFQVTLVKPKKKSTFGSTEAVVMKKALKTSEKEALKVLRDQRKVFLELPFSVHTICCKSGLSSVGYVTEHCSHRDLKSYLMTHRHDCSIPVSQLLKFSHDIASACDFLIKHQPQLLVHCLSASNVLLTDQLQCKLTGFGPANEIVERDRIEQKLQVYECDRWRAQEVLESCIHTDMSDVWSYGVLLFEIVTYGEIPYAGISDSGIRTHIFHSNVEPKPKHISDRLYDIMKTCWEFDPASRPPFEQLVSTLTSLREHGGRHINLKTLNQLKTSPNSHQEASTEPVNVNQNYEPENQEPLYVNQPQKTGNSGYVNVPMPGSSSDSVRDYENVEPPPAIPPCVRDTAAVQEPSSNPAEKAEQSRAAVHRVKESGQNFNVSSNSAENPWLKSLQRHLRMKKKI